MNPTFFTKISLPLLFFAAAIGIYLNYFSSSTVISTKQCSIENEEACVVGHLEQQVSVRFLQDIEVEEELTLNITIPKSTKIKQMWVQGINMYMGKTAVLTDSVYAHENKKTYSARLFLGTCSEPVMRWQLVIQTLDNNQLEQSWFFNFSTDRNKKS